MDLFTITAAVVSGAAVGAFLTRWHYQYLLDDMRWAAREEARDADATFETLMALRRNAFITNSKGHRVRYTNATAEERAKAEGAV